MPYRTTENFVEKRGIEKLLWLAEALNAGESYEEMAGRLGLSVGRLSQIVTNLFLKRFVFSPGAEEYVEFYLNAGERSFEDVRKELQENIETRLRYIPGTGTRRPQGQ